MRTKSFVYVAICLFSFVTTNAQNWERYQSIYVPSPNYYLPVTGDKANEYLLERGITRQHVKTTNVSKSGKEKSGKYINTLVFNQQGLVAENYGTKKDKVIWKSVYEFDSSGKPISKKKYNKKGEISGREKMERKPLSINSNYIKINKKGDTIFQALRSALDTNLLSSEDKYYKNGRLKSTWKNEYYPNKSLKKSVLFNRPGKLKYVWDYQCKEEGIETLKHKDTTTICKIKEDAEDGSSTFIYQYVDEKGELRKTITKLNKANKIISYKSTKGAEDELTFEQYQTYAADDSTLLKFESRNYRKGQEVHHNLWKYDEAGNQTLHTYQEYKKGKLTQNSSTRFEYDAKQRPIKKISEDAEKNTKRIYEITYE